MTHFETRRDGACAVVLGGDCAVRATEAVGASADPIGTSPLGLAVVVGQVGVG